MTVDGHLRDWFTNNVDATFGNAVKPNIKAVKEKFSDDPLSDALLKSSIHAHIKGGLNLGGAYVAFNPFLNNGTYFIALDLPGPDINNHNLDSHATTAGPVLPFDADGNGNANNIDLGGGTSECLSGDLADH